jgi:hypothetical protein
MLPFESRPLEINHLRNAILVTPLFLYPYKLAGCVWGRTRRVQTGRIPDAIRLAPPREHTPLRPDAGLTGNGVRQGAAGAFAAVELPNGGFEISGGKVRPAFLQEHEFRKGAFPKEKIGKTLFAAGANQ